RSPRRGSRRRAGSFAPASRCPASAPGRPPAGARARARCRRSRSPRSPAPAWPRAPVRPGRSPRGRLPEPHGARSPTEEGGGERVAEPAEVLGEPPSHPEAALPGGALVPFHRHLADLPAQAMTLHEQLDAVREAERGLDRDGLDDPTGEEAKAVARITGR